VAGEVRGRRYLVAASLCDAWIRGRMAGVPHSATATKLPPVFGLVIVDDETGVNHAGHPAEQGKQQAKDETQDAAGHQNRDRPQDDAEKIAERFHGISRTFARSASRCKSTIAVGPNRRVGFFESGARLRFAGLAQFALGMHSRHCLVGLGLRSRGGLGRTTGKAESSDCDKAKESASLHQWYFASRSMAGWI